MTTTTTLDTRTGAAGPRPGRRGLLMAALAAAALMLAAPSSASAQDAADFFRQNCMSCHTIGGGRLTGPDLKDLTQRRDRAWVMKFVQNPKATIDGGDPIAQQLFSESRGVVMPNVNGLTPDRVSALIDLIDAESKLPESQFKGLQIPDTPFSEADIAKGRSIFLGTTALQKQGSACVGCHTVRGLGGLGGGRLGPDLSKVFERLQGRRNLASWLIAPATQTMQPIFKAHPLQPEEILPLVAFLEDAAVTGGEDSSPSRLNFMLLGLGGTGIGLVLFDTAWRRRFRAVRRPLLDDHRRRGGAR